MCIAKASRKLSFRVLVVAPSLISKTLRNRKKHKGNVIFFMRRAVRDELNMPEDASDKSTACDHS